MKLLLIFSIFLLTVVATQNDKTLWKEFKEKHSKLYKNILQDKISFSVFQNNLRKIEEHNKKYESGESSYFLKITKFADLTQEEIEEKFNVIQEEQYHYSETFKLAEGAQVPAAIDWRDKGAVLEVKDQGNCGAYYAFSATGAIEGQNVIVHNKSISLSEQELVDCSLGNGNMACDSGTVLHSFKYIQRYGITTTKSYPYDNKHKNCRRVTDAGITLTGYVQVEENETALMEAVGTIGPVTTAVSSYDIVHYGGGIFNKPDCRKSLNHAVLIVGYGVLNNTDYWIVKNSWGTEWGEKGFIRMSRNKGHQCGIGHLTSYPKIQ